MKHIAVENTKVYRFFSDIHESGPGMPEINSHVKWCRDMVENV